MGMGLKTHAVPSWILFECLTLCTPVCVCFKSGGPWVDKKWDRAAYVMPDWEGRMAGKYLQIRQVYAHYVSYNQCR